MLPMRMKGLSCKNRKYGSKEEKERAFELLDEQFMRSHEMC